MAQEVMHTVLSESSQLVPVFDLDDSCTCRLHVYKGMCRLCRTVLLSLDHNSNFVSWESLWASLLVQVMLTCWIWSCPAFVLFWTHHHYITKPHCYCKYTCTLVAYDSFVCCNICIQPSRDCYEAADDLASTKPLETQAFLKRLKRLVGPTQNHTETDSCTPAIFFNVSDSHIEPQQSSLLTLAFEHDCLTHITLQRSTCSGGDVYLGKLCPCMYLPQSHGSLNNSVSSIVLRQTFCYLFLELTLDCH